MAAAAVVQTIHQTERQQTETRVYDGDFSVDQAVIDALPPGSRLLSANKFGRSAWTITARLDVELSDESQASFFVKCASGDAGHVMMEGEFNSMTELYNTAPDLVPRPVSWGQFKASGPEVFFFLSEFIDMNDRTPEPTQLCSKLAKLHRTSVSPTGQFGFHITTCQGRIPQMVAWESSWTVFFTKLLKHVISLDVETNGLWEDLQTLQDRLLERVIAILLGNLAKDGRTIKPSLIHSDLWEGNTGTSYQTGDIYLFDAAAMYAHHEMEIGNWRCHYNKIHNRVYTRTYLKYHGPSEPREEWDDRNRLYSIYYNVIYSVNHMSQGKAVRQTAYDDIYFLVDKYAAFEDGAGPPRLNEGERASLSGERDHTKS